MWGGAALKAVSAKLAKGWPTGLTVLTGDDLYHLDQAQARILTHLVPEGAGSFALSVVGDESITTGALVGAARSSGMFASRRVVYLRDIAGLEGDPEPLAAYAAHAPADSFLIVRAPKLDRKRKLHKALAEAGLCLDFRVPANAAGFKELEAEVGAMAAARGFELDLRSVALLMAACGPDLNRIAGELDKLGLWQGAIDTGTVRDLVAGSVQLSGWELADALTERDAVSALRSARRSLDAGDEPIRMVGGLASRARALLKAKGMIEAGASPQAAVDAARAWYFREGLQKGVKRYTLDELLAMPSRLFEADRTFKSRSLDKGAVLQALVMGLTR
jgi:DNA polymerase-3 subunit delta